MDACFKLKEENNTYEKQPTVLITFIDQHRITQIAFIIMMSGYEGEDLTNALFEVEKVLTKLYEIEDWEPIFMIDDGSTEKCALSLIGYQFIICKFHLIRAWSRKLRSLRDISPDTCEMIMSKLYELYNSRTDKEYNDRFEMFQQTSSIPDEFLTYFLDTWHLKKFYRKWTCIERQSCYADWATNNATESVFRRMQGIMGKKERRMNKYVSSMIQLLETEKYHLALIRYKNDTEKEAEARLEDGKKFVPVPVDGSDTLFNVKSSQCTHPYQCDLFDMCCNCFDFFYNCRPCKHLYSCMIYYLKKMNIHLPPDSPWSHYINAVFLRLHFPNEFQYWKAHLRASAYATTHITNEISKNKESNPESKKGSKKGSKNPKPTPSFDIDGVEGVRLHGKEKKPEILAIWANTFDKDGDQLASWADFDSVSNFDAAKKFIQKVERFVKVKRGTRQCFDSIELQDDVGDPYCFQYQGRRLKRYPDMNSFKIFVDRFLYNN